MRRIQLQDLFEAGPGLLGLPANEIVIAEVIQKRGRGRAFRQGLLVATLRFAAFALGVQPRGLAQDLLLRSGGPAESQREKQKADDQNSTRRPSCTRRPNVLPN